MIVWDDLLQSDAILFASAMLGIVATSVAIARDYLPKDEPESAPATLRAIVSERERAA